MRVVKVTICSLNQWALDFEGNYARILESILTAKAQGSILRTGPELEVCGYGCNDHFFETETIDNCWDVLARLLSDGRLRDIICDVGMPVIHRMALYNCRVVFFNGKIILIRPKMVLAEGGNYRENRWFRPWLSCFCDQFDVPQNIQTITRQKTAPIGNGIIRISDFKIGFEICEELFAPKSPHVDLSLHGVDIICNGSASHYETGKLERRMELMKNATLKNGGLYLYSNLVGCDGERVCYDGCSMAFLNGTLLSQTNQFSFDDVEVSTITVDLDAIVSYRLSMHYPQKNNGLNEFYCNPVELGCVKSSKLDPLTSPIQFKLHSAEEELRLGASLWLWDILRRSGFCGFVLPLSGGIDSCASALLVYSMATILIEYLHYPKSSASIKKKLVYLLSEDVNIFSVKDLCRALLKTCYMSTQFSSTETRERAASIARAIGSDHKEMDISSIIHDLEYVLRKTFALGPEEGLFEFSHQKIGSQNIQARTRMIMSYMIAQYLPMNRERGVGGYLVLGSSNADESLSGYFTKYDCSSADLNPIGSINKSYIHSFVSYCKKIYEIDQLTSVLEATPSAELTSSSDSGPQSDEKDMGLTYEELEEFGNLRMTQRLGPFDMFTALTRKWSGKLSISNIAAKTKLFFSKYAKNRHKMTTLTPAFHAQRSSPDDNRNDLRPFLYNTEWVFQFQKIDQNTLHQTT